MGAVVSNAEKYLLNCGRQLSQMLENFWWVVGAVVSNTEKHLLSCGG